MAQAASENPRRALRHDLRAQRSALTPAQRLHAAQAVAERLRLLPDAGSADASPGYVAGYWAVGGELPLHVVQMRLSPDQIWCLPVVQSDGLLRFAPWRPGDALHNNRYGIPEPTTTATLPPEAMSLVLLPLLGFDRRGHRLGMGGGYYDRSFAFRHERPAPPRLIGVGYACQEIAEFSPEPWDVRMDAVVTEQARLDFA